MATYRIAWTIDLDADDALEAAQKAQSYQRKPGAEVGVFDVTDDTGRTLVVDLDEDTIEERPRHVARVDAKGVNAATCDHCWTPTLDLEPGSCSLGDPCQLCPSCRVDGRGRAGTELRTTRVRLTGIRALADQASLLGTVEIFGVRHHAWFLRVNADADAGQVAVADPDGRLDEFLALDLDGGPMKTVSVPGYPGEYLLIIYPEGD